MAAYIDKSRAYDYGTLYDWLISSVGPEPPVWTDAHIDELMNDFLIFPNDTPIADVVAKEKYDKLLRAARRMHEWIFLNSVDEAKAYQECGLTDDDNALLGYIGKMKLEVTDE